MFSVYKTNDFFVDSVIITVPSSYYALTVPFTFYPVPLTHGIDTAITMGLSLVRLIVWRVWYGTLALSDPGLSVHKKT